MSFFNLKLKRKNENLLILTVPYLTRILMLFFSAAIGSTFILEPGLDILPLIFLTVLIITALYKESWSFDTEASRAVYSFGLLFIYKKTVVPFEKIENFKIEGFVRGSMTEKPTEDENEKNSRKLFKTVYWKLTLENSELGELTINTVKGRQKEILMNYAKEIARITQKPLLEE